MKTRKNYSYKKFLQWSFEEALGFSPSLSKIDILEVGLEKYNLIDYMLAKVGDRYYSTRQFLPGMYRTVVVGEGGLSCALSI